jgi:hypothetical protein
MSKISWHGAGAGASALIGTAVGIIGNLVTDRWSWALVLALAALVLSLVEVETLRTLPTSPFGRAADREPGGTSRLGPAAFTGRHAVLCLAVIGLVAVFSLVWLVPRAGAEHSNPISCAYSPYTPRVSNGETPSTEIRDLKYRCTMDRWWDDDTIPVLLAPRTSAEVGRLKKGSGKQQYFVCQVHGDPISFGKDTRIHTEWWALTLADEEDAPTNQGSIKPPPPKCGFIPQFYFINGDSNRAERLLDTCNKEQEERGGKEYGN